MYHEYLTLQDARNDVNYLNNYWGFNAERLDTSHFSDTDITEYLGKYYILFHPSWTFILDTPIEVNMPEGVYGGNF